MDTTSTPAPSATMTTYECDRNCGFYKNYHPGPCRLIHCDGTVRAVEWVRTEAVAQAWDEGATKASPHGGGYLRSLLIENPYRDALTGQPRQPAAE